MNSKVIKFLRFFITFVVVGIATVGAILLWRHYMNGTWTRDGKIRAHIVMIAPDVDGLVSAVLVHDNEFVKKGQALFTINQVRFIQALERAKDNAVRKKEQYEMKLQQYKRRKSLNSNMLSQENKNDAKFQVAIAKAAYQEAMMLVATAKLNLHRTVVKSTVDGWVTNLRLRKGEFLRRGESHISIVQKDSFWVYGYFEENKIPLLHKSEPVVMQMLGTNYILKGYIQSIARGITDRDNSIGSQNLANVQPIFQWIRLAQRIPVRIHIDYVPKGFRLVAGMTCTIRVNKPD